MNNLKNVGLDKSTPYTDGLLNDYTDSYFDPDISAVSQIKNKITNDALELYAKKVRAYNWAYHNIDIFFPSEMIVRRYNNKSEFNYHHDDIIEEIFPQWFVRRKNILTCNIYLNDDNEYFWFDVFETKADAENYNYAAYDKGYISNDSGSVTAGATYSYSVAGSNNETSKAVKEGESATFTITRTNTGGAADTASTIYISTTAGTASEDDFEVITNKEIKFAPNETTKTITVGTKKDAETDDDEYFWFDIYKTIYDAENYNYYQWDKGYIDDDASAANALNNYTYAITTTHSTSNKVTEGGEATFTITRTKTSGSDVAATVFIKTSEGTADLDDYESISKQAIEFKANETSKTITVQTNTDDATEGFEYFWLDLFKSGILYDSNEGKPEY